MMEGLETKALDAIDFATATQDKMCIERDHATGIISWRFAAPQADPIGLMVRVLVYELLRNSDLKKQVDALEQRLNEIERRMSAGG